jgi:hypothetical protein
MPSGALLALVNDGLPKRGYLSISTILNGSNLIKPGRTLIHAPRMFFHMEQGALLNLGVANIQLISGVLWPLPCTSSLVWSAWFLINFFHSYPPGANPLIKSFASKASDYILGSMMPRPPLEIGWMSVSHFTFARAGVALPPQIKFLIIPRASLHIFWGWGSSMQPCTTWRLIGHGWLSRSSLLGQGCCGPSWLACLLGRPSFCQNLLLWEGGSRPGSPGNGRLLLLGPIWGLPFGPNPRFFPFYLPKWRPTCSNLSWRRKPCKIFSGRFRPCPCWVGRL